MKTTNHRLTVNSTSIILLLSFILIGCTVTNRIFEVNDIVYATKRLELKLAYSRHNKRSPITYMEQSIIKEIANNETTYKVYDVLILTSKSYKLEDKVFLLINNEVFPMVIEGKEYENTKEIEEKKEDVMTSDSTSISVVTGYSENNRKITRFSYELPDHVIAKIKDADQVIFRYYSGPDMLTITLKGIKISKLKQLIDKI